MASGCTETGVTVTFDRSDPVYRAGEILAGWIELDLKHDIRVKAMKVHIHGQSRVSWDEKRTYTKGAAPTISHKHSQVLLDHQVYLIRKGQYTPEYNCDKDGNGCGSQPTKRPYRKSLCFPLVAGSEEPEGVVIPAGPHRYSFEYILPRNLPSTFDGKWGGIAYAVKFTMERPWKSTIEKDKVFTVQSVVDFNDEPELMRPVFASGEFNMVTCCFVGEVYVEVKILRKGFILGDVIPIHVEIYNNSGNAMRDHKISLIQHAIFRAGTRIKKTSTTLRSYNRGEISPDDVKVWDLKFEVPNDVVPSTIRNEEWKGITVRYTISVCITPSWWGSNFVLPTQIIIGTIPLRRETAKRYLSHLMLATSNSSNSLPVTPKRRPKSYSETYSQKASEVSFNISSQEMAKSERNQETDNVDLIKKGRGNKVLGYARQSEPCFRDDSSNKGSFVGNGRRASAYELGVASKIAQNQTSNTLSAADKFGNKPQFSSSLETGIAPRFKTTIKEAWVRLKSVSEERSPRGSSSTDDRSIDVNEVTTRKDQTIARISDSNGTTETENSST